MRLFFTLAIYMASSSSSRESYDFSRSTEENYCTEEVDFVGKHAAQRAKLDYEYHLHYTRSRQLLHDQIMEIYEDVEIDDGEYTCEVPEENWLVFTAGPMGAGKSHVLRHLSAEGLFPLRAFVHVDPDELRMHLPEFKEYNDLNPNTAGRLTQKEVGYISEVLTLDALEQGKNALVDGSLRDKEWYGRYIAKLKSLFPRLKIAIIQVTASEENVLSRAMRRAESTGRLVPEEVLLSTMRAIPESVEALKEYADYMAVFSNDDAPKMVRSSSGDLSSNKFREVWRMTCRLNQPRIRRGSKRSMSDMGEDSNLSYSSQGTAATGAGLDINAMFHAVSSPSRLPAAKRLLQEPDPDPAVEDPTLKPAAPAQIEEYVDV